MQTDDAPMRSAHDVAAESRWAFLNGTYELSDSINLRGGIDNLFNKRPPIGNVNTAANLTLGQLPGGGFNSQFYDTLGRRFYIGANVQF